MAGPTVLIFHRPASAGDAPLVRLLADVRGRLAEAQAALFERAGAGEVRQIGRSEDAVAPSTFGEALGAMAPRRGGLVVLGSGAVPRLNGADARRLVEVAAAGGRRALTNNRYSSDVCAIGAAAALVALPPLPADNALPRWLEERAGFSVAELAGRDRLALDIDTVQDIALWALAPRPPAWLDEFVHGHDLAIARLAELRALARDPFAELLVFGRAGSATLRWLERNVRCRVRFLAEERGLRASSPLAIGAATTSHPAARNARMRRPPRATLGRLLERAGPSALGELVAELADGAIIDSRVLLADHLGADEDRWPPPADRYASDLLRPSEIEDGWLRALTESAAASRRPILLGAHSLIGPGIRLLLAARGEGGQRLT
jgi:CTP:molybdopterin cytidylyltransferase MocA